MAGDIRTAGFQDSFGCARPIIVGRTAGGILTRNFQKSAAGNKSPGGGFAGIAQAPILAHRDILFDAPDLKRLHRSRLEHGFSISQIDEMCQFCFDARTKMAPVSPEPTPISLGPLPFSDSEQGILGGLA
jgi:hypothetical protein